MADPRPAASGAVGVFAAFCTCLLGLGLARFAYTPLIPAVIAAHWFSAGQAVFLGAANIGGYLVGALGARPMAKLVGGRATLRACMVLACGSLFACATPGSLAWFTLWRAASGVAGAGLMVLAAPRVLPLVAPRHRGLASGVIFTGIGIGIAASGTLLPALLAHGLTLTWRVLGATGAVITGAAWFLLPPDAPEGHVPSSEDALPRLAPGLRALCAAYGVSALSQVPTMLFLADFVARDLHRGVAAGAHAWELFGVGALAGPLVAGMAADRLGAVVALRWLWATQAAANVALAWLAWTGSFQPLVCGGAAAFAGAGIPGLVVLVLGRSQDLSGDSMTARGHAWSRATAAFALGQTVGAYGLSAMFAQGGGYVMLFAVGAGAVVVALLVGEVSARA